MVDRKNSWELQEGMEVRKNMYDWWNDDSLQGDLLSFALVHALETLEMGHQGLVYGIIFDKICLEFCGLMRKKGGKWKYGMRSLGGGMFGS